MRVCVFVCVHAPECLGKAQRKGPGHRTSLLQGRLPAADPLISGNKGGRACNSSKIAHGVGGVEGCRESDTMPCGPRISYDQLKRQYTELISPLSSKGKCLMCRKASEKRRTEIKEVQMNGRIHHLSCCVYCALLIWSVIMCMCVACMWLCVTSSAVH